MYDANLFRCFLSLECEKVADHYKNRGSNEAKNEAMMMLDGIFKGCYAMAKAMGEDVREGGIMDIAREITEKYLGKILIGPKADSGQFS